MFFFFRKEIIASMDRRNIYDNRHNMYKLSTLRSRKPSAACCPSTHSLILKLFSLCLTLFKCLCLLNSDWNIPINGLCFSRKCFSLSIISGGYCDCLKFNGRVMTGLYFNIISGPMNHLEFVIQHFLRNQSQDMELLQENEHTSLSQSTSMQMNSCIYF